MAAAACAPSSWASCALSATSATRTRASSATLAPRPTARLACAPVRLASPARAPCPSLPPPAEVPGTLSDRPPLLTPTFPPENKLLESSPFLWPFPARPLQPCFQLASPTRFPLHKDHGPVPDPPVTPFFLPLPQPKMVPPASLEERYIGVESPSRAAANTSALAWTGRWAACPCAVWTFACPAQTAPSREGSSYPGNAARSGCAMSPRTTPWLALPLLVS